MIKSLDKSSYIIGIISKLKLEHMDHANKIKEKDKLHKEQREFELLHEIEFSWLRITQLVKLKWYYQWVLKLIKDNS